MTFFDLNSPDDLALINAAVRDHDELNTVAEMAEWEVIEAYTEGAGDRAVVKLKGYDQDDPSESEADLKEALRRTIADVVSTLLLDYDNDRGVLSERQGNRSVTYGRASTWRDWPTGWQSKLTRFDRRTPAYSI